MGHHSSFWKSFFYIAITLLIIINIGLLVSVIKKSKVTRRAISYEQFSPSGQSNVSFYNLPCPEVEMVDFQGKNGILKLVEIIR